MERRKVSSPGLSNDCGLQWRSLARTIVVSAAGIMVLGISDVGAAGEKEPALHTILSPVGSTSVKELYPFLNGGKFDGPVIKENGVRILQDAGGNISGNFPAISDRRMLVIERH